jgi:hypothetical protein
MKRFTTNPFFYVSIVVIAVLVFQIAQIVRGQSRGVWTGPPGPPTAGQPLPPIDVSDKPQFKEGNFGIGPNRDKLDEQVSIRSEIRGIMFMGDGDNAAIVYDRGLHRVRVRHTRGGQWFDLGGGGSTGGGVWRAGLGSGDIFYDRGKVGIGTNDVLFGGLQIDIPGGTGGLDQNNGLGISYGGDSGKVARLWVDSAGTFHIHRGVGSSIGLSMDQTGNFTMLGGKLGVGVDPSVAGVGNVAVRNNPSENSYSQGFAVSTSGGKTGRLWIDEDDFLHLTRRHEWYNGIAINSSGLLNAPRGISQYPSRSGERTGNVCVDHFAAVRYRTQGFNGLSWLEVGGTGPEEGSWNNNCPVSDGAGGSYGTEDTLAWRWSRATGRPEFRFRYSSVRNTKQFSFITISPNMNNGDIINLDDVGDLNPGIEPFDEDDGARIANVQYDLEWATFVDAGYESAP